MRVDLCFNPQQFSRDFVLVRIPALREVLRQHRVQAAYIFGSFLENHSSPWSDLDIAIVPPMSLDRYDWPYYYNNLYGDICQLLQGDNIDIVLLNLAPLSLQFRAIASGVPILVGPEEAERQERVLGRYADLVIWRQENWEVTRQLMRQGVTKAINMIEQNRVERFVFLLRDALQELQALNLESLGLQGYLADKRTKALSEHYLRIALEATFDLGRHVIVKTGLGTPQEYRDVGKILREKGIFSPQLGQELEAMAGMRNVLVHLYWDIDYPLLYSAIVERLNSFEQFLEQIFLYIDRLEGE